MGMNRQEGSRFYSIGYQKLSVQTFAVIASPFDVVVDTRSYPTSRIPGWSRAALEALLGKRYRWEGQKLGGKHRETLSDGGREYLLVLHAQLRATNGLGLLLCLEEAPGDCHRHHQLAMGLLPGHDVRHIHRREIIAASELHRALAQDTAYAYTPLEEEFPHLQALLRKRKA
jgi:hypothetical protein